MINTSDEGIYYVPRSYTAETEIYREVNFSQRGLMKKILRWFNQRREPQKEFFVWEKAQRCGGVVLRRLVKKADILGKRLPPSPPLRSAFWEFFWCFLFLRLWFYVFWNGFYTSKVIFIQLQEFPTPLFCRCCSVTKQSDSSIAEALKASKMHFYDPSRRDKMCFE